MHHAASQHTHTYRHKINEGLKETGSRDCDWMVAVLEQSLTHVVPYVAKTESLFSDLNPEYSSLWIHFTAVYSLITLSPTTDFTICPTSSRSNYSSSAYSPWLKREGRNRTATFFRLYSLVMSCYKSEALVRLENCSVSQMESRWNPEAEQVAINIRMVVKSNKNMQW